MKRKREIESELEKAETKFLADLLPGPSAERQRREEYDKGYIDALQWVLERSKKSQ